MTRLARRTADVPRVAFVVPNLNSGGAERAALNLAGARAESFVVAEAPGGDFMDDSLAAQVRFAAASQTGPTHRVRRARNLASALREVRPDVVVATLSPLVTATAAARLGVPVVQWVQSPWSRTMGLEGKGARPLVRRAGLRVATAQSKLIAATTPGLLHECRSFGVDDAKLALLPNGLELPPRLSAGRTEAEMYQVVSVSRLEAPKRHDLLLQAVAALRGEVRLRLSVIGSGSDEPELRALARRLRVDDIVEFAGFVPDPAPHIAQADVFVLPTDYEGFGNVLVQALGCGVPIVVSDVPYGPRFIVGEVQLAVLVEPGSSAALATGIETVLSRGAPTAAEREEARRRAAEFTVERVANRFEELVGIVVGGLDVPAELRQWP